MTERYNPIFSKKNKTAEAKIKASAVEQKYTCNGVEVSYTKDENLVLPIKKV